MPFHLGKPILVMTILAAVAGVATSITRRVEGRAQIEHWAFSEQNWRLITSTAGGESLVERYRRESHETADVKLIQYRAMNTRLSSLFMSNTGWPELPDVVDIEIGSVGRYFRPPTSEVGLLPLNDLLAEHGWTDRLVKTRFAPWSKDGVIFGIPQDVHPVVVVYNDKLFREAGVDLATSETWDQFIANCKTFQRYWRSKGETRRWALEMAESNAGTIVTMLLQRGVNLVDDKGNICMTDERVLDTLVTYCGMMTGPDALGVGTSPGNDAFSQDLASGFVNAMLCADWRLRYVRDYGGQALSGNMRVMPMPSWPDSTYRTSTMGGSMVGIPRNARDPERSFRYIESVYLSPEATRSRAGTSYVLPAVFSAWESDRTDAPEPFFGGQPIRRMIATLAAQVPPRYVTPASSTAESELSMVLIDALAFARANGEVGLREHCRELLAASADRLRRQIAHGSFDK